MCLSRTALVDFLVPRRAREGSSSSNTIFLGFVLWAPGWGWHTVWGALGLGPLDTSRCSRRRNHGLELTRVSRHPLNRGE